MTQGKPLGLIFKFAMHLMLGNVFQQLYVVVDTAIVGNVLGFTALGAVGTCDWLVWFIIGLIQGITQGFSVLISMEFGAGSKEGLRRSTGESVTLTAISAVGLTVLAAVLARSLLRLIRVPDEILDASYSYLLIIVLGIPVTAAYNMSAAVLRALGDGKTPLTAMIIASLLNVGLDYFAILVLRMGVAGAAAATVAAQLAAAVFCVIRLMKAKTIGMARTDLALERTRVKKLLGLGLPLAFQNSVIAGGGLIVQAIVNGFGTVFLAGYTATNKIFGILEGAGMCYGTSVTTYAGQNLGAAKMDRIRRGVLSAALTAVLTSLGIGIVMILCGKPVLGIFITGAASEAAEAMGYAYRYLFLSCCFLWVLYLLHVYRSALIGFGKSVLAMASGGVEFVMRVCAALFLTKAIGGEGIFWGEVLAWAGAVLLLMPAYFVTYRGLEKENATPDTAAAVPGREE